MLQQVLGDPEVKASLTALGQEMAPLQSLAEASKAYAEEAAQYRAIARAINLQPQ